MTIQEFELEIKKIDSKLSIIPSPQAPDMCGVYYESYFITGIPNNYIYPETRSDYTNPFGTPHKTSIIAIAQIKAWLDNLEENIGLEKELDEELPTINTNKDGEYKYTADTLPKKYQD